MSNLPALTAEEIAALPDGWWLSSKGRAFMKRGPAWRLGNQVGIRGSSKDLAEVDGGITARLVDAGPLEARVKLLKECLQDIIEYHGDYPEGQRELFEAITRAEAALNQENDDAE